MEGLKFSIHIQAAGETWGCAHHLERGFSLRRKNSDWAVESVTFLKGWVEGEEIMKDSKK